MSHLQYDAWYLVSVGLTLEVVESGSLSLLGFGLKECRYRFCFAAVCTGRNNWYLIADWLLLFSRRSAEYLAQSGVMASLLKQQREETQGTGTSVSKASESRSCSSSTHSSLQDWSLDELCGVCAILKVRIFGRSDAGNICYPWAN